ncbi:uncharacterized protein [Clytia hemisphaerica]|uniref:uncharacterized protein n=1 Tax=Clytia hemisphaerica TaxID=252671 RepID=UPI0034D73D53
MTTATGEIEQCLKNLAPKIIDPTNCTFMTSIYQEISKPAEEKRRLDHQAKQWFNLGNSQTFNDPISAAEYLLEREYGESFLFQPNHAKPIFIPSEFMSNQYCKPTHLLISDFDKIESKMKETLLNLKKESPDFWFTKQLDSFLQQQQQPYDEINQKEFDKWILKIKTMYLMVKEIQPENLPENLPSTSPADFIKDCMKELLVNAPASNLINTFSSSKSFKNIAREINKSPIEDSRLKWFFDLQIADRGENMERILIDKLHSLKDNDILKDTIILSSVNFLTEFSNKRHQEFDCLIFSWTRKLIIGIEAKRQINDTRAFEQLNKYHSIFEQKLGDQLGLGWSFFPVVCAEKEDISLPPSNHYISSNTDIENWLSNVVNAFPESRNSQSLEQLKKILQIMVFTIHISKKDQPRPITSSYWVDYVSDVIDSLSNFHNIVFYSQQQLPLMCSDNPKYNKVLFEAGYGTGKTFLLEEKAIALSKTKQYKDGVCYVVCNGKGLHYFERKHKLEQYGIHIIYNIESLIDLNKPQDLSHVKAIFFDEWNYDYDVEEDDSDSDLSGDDTDKNEPLKSRLINEIPICWVAPNSSNRNRAFGNQWKKFTVVNLNLNLRNTKEISNKAFVVAEQDLFEYANGLSKPPQNFPNGCRPTCVSSLDEALVLARNLETKKGILLVSDSEQINLNTKEKVKYHHEYKLDFSFPENPIDFLNEGNILVTSRNYLSGFEWPVVIYQLNENDEGDIERHECNIISRCTSLLIIVGKETSTHLNNFPFAEIASLLEVLTSDTSTLSDFKKLARNYVMDHLSRYKRRRWLHDLQPILKRAIEQISQTSNVTITFSMLEDLFRFLLKDLLNEKNKSWLSLPCVIGNIFADFDFGKLESYLTIDNILKLYTEFRFEKMSTQLKEEFWKHCAYTGFDIEELPEQMKLSFWEHFEIDILPQGLGTEPRLAVLKVSKNDSIISKQFKFYVGKYIISRSLYHPIRYRIIIIENYNRRETWLQDVLPILEKTIENILQASNETITFSMLEELFKALLKDVAQTYNRSYHESNALKTLSDGFDKTVNVNGKFSNDKCIEWYQKWLNVVYLTTFMKSQHPFLLMLESYTPLG